MDWQRLFPHNWNDVLALFLLIVIPFLWILGGRGIIDFDKLGDLKGALLLTWGYVVQYYFRRSPPANGGT